MLANGQLLRRILKGRLVDATSAFKSEVFRPIASIVLPGMLALSPFAIVAGNAIPEVGTLFKEATALFVIFLAAAATVVGMLLENIGTGIERGIDRCMDVEYLPGASEIWAAYLALPCSDTFARKYLGSLVTRLKFINSMLPATYLFAAGMWALHFQLNRWGIEGMIIMSFGVFVLSAWLFRTSTELSEAALFSRLKMLPEAAQTKIPTEAHSVSRGRHLAYVLTELRTSRVSEADYSDLDRWALVRAIFGVLIGPRPEPKTNSKTSGHPGAT